MTFNHLKMFFFTATMEWFASPKICIEVLSMLLTMYIVYKYRIVVGLILNHQNWHTWTKKRWFASPRICIQVLSMSVCRKDSQPPKLTYFFKKTLVFQPKNLQFFLMGLGSWKNTNNLRYAPLETFRFSNQHHRQRKVCTPKLQAKPESGLDSLWWLGSKRSNWFDE